MLACLSSLQRFLTSTEFFRSEIISDSLVDVLFFSFAHPTEPNLAHHQPEAISTAD